MSYLFGQELSSLNYSGFGLDVGESGSGLSYNRTWFKNKKLYFIGCRHKIFKSYEFPEGSVVVDPNRYIPLKEGVDIVQVGICRK